MNIDVIFYWVPDTDLALEFYSGTPGIEQAHAIATGRR